MRLTIRVVPNASQDSYVGLMEDGSGTHKIRLRAPAVEGKANKALVEFLAKKLRVPKGSITFISGETARLKIIEVSGIDEADVLSRLG